MGKTPGKRTPAAAGLDPAAALRAVQSRLSSLADPGALSAFLKRIRHRASDAEPLSLHEDAEAACFLHRLGVISNPNARKRSADEVEGFLEAASRAGGPAPAVASVLVRGYASGLYGVTTEAVCGEAPKCGDCPLSTCCREFNSPGSAAPTYAPGERPSERIETAGARDLSVSELMALVAAATPAKEAEAVEACGRLLSEHGGLRRLSDLRPADVAGTKGVSRRSARAIAAAMELTRRWAAETRPVGRAFRSGSDFFEHYRLRLRDLKKEVFVAALLDQKNRFLTDEICSEGSLTSSLVHPREVFRRAVRESAAAIAFVHNHPSGDPTPSGHDIDITERLLEVSKLIGIRMLDHVIVGETTYVSFVEQGLMPSEM